MKMSGLKQARVMVLVVASILIMLAASTAGAGP
jgi:hypothetical protein